MSRLNLRNAKRLTIPFQSSSLEFSSNEKASNSKVSFVRLVSEKTCQNATS